MKNSEVVSVEFRPAKGGVVSETRMRSKRSGQGGGPSFDHESETAVHPDMDSAMTHMQKHMGGCFSGGKDSEGKE